jgi:phosphate transport system substrate-binding protein
LYFLLESVNIKQTEVNKMRRSISALLAGLMLGSALLSACAPASTATPEVVKETVPVQQTVVVTQVARPTEAHSAIPGSIQINSAGATFPLPLYTEWTDAYQYVDPAVAINYQGIGSGGGKKAIIDGTVDFAGSDSLVSDDEYTQGGDLQMYPAVAGAVVVIYNISGLEATDPALILDRQTLVDIYNAKITTWNDPAMAALNPDLKDKLPNEPITVALHSDGSGTTEIFTKALTSFSPDWTAGGAASIGWPVDKAGNGGGKGNPGVAAAVQNTPNSLGYVELDYALVKKIAYT